MRHRLFRRHAGAVARAALRVAPGLAAMAMVMALVLSLPLRAQVNVGVGVRLPGVSIDINLPAFPQLVAVPDTPVYYAPQTDANYFFYDGLYWLYEGDTWYSSSWYNGPWQAMGPDEVPLYLLRVPVRYYRRPPAYFRSWRADAPPHWGERWGGGWERGHAGWDRWDRRAAPPPAPLPVYQRGFSGDRYPRAVEQQRELRNQNYRWQPREAVVRQHFEAPPEKGGGPANGPVAGPPPQRMGPAESPGRAQRSPQTPHPEPVQRERPAGPPPAAPPAAPPREQAREQAPERGPERAAGPGRGEERREDRGREHR